MQDSDVLALLRHELGAVCEGGGIDGLREEMVVHDFGKVVRCHVCNCGAEALEGRVGGGEDGYVGLVAEGGHLVGGVEGAFEGGYVEGVQGVGDVGGWDEEGVDYLDDTAIELKVLTVVVSLFVSHSPRFRILTALTA